MPNDNSVIMAIATHMARVAVAQGLQPTTDGEVTFEAHETAQFEAALGRKLTADEWRTAADEFLKQAWWAFEPPGRPVARKPTTRTPAVRTPASDRKPKHVGDGTETETDVLEQARQAARQAARGTYQKGLVAGQQSWAGSDLKGRAGQYAGRYAKTRAALIKRANQALHRYGFTIVTVLVLDGQRWHRRALVCGRGQAWDLNSGKEIRAAQLKPADAIRCGLQTPRAPESVGGVRGPRKPTEAARALAARLALAADAAIEARDFSRAAAACDRLDHIAARTWDATVDRLACECRGKLWSRTDKATAPKRSHR
jgi:hypothetical protein